MIGTKKDSEKLIVINSYEIRIFDKKSETFTLVYKDFYLSQRSAFLVDYRYLY